MEEPERPFLTRSLRVPDRVAGHLLGDDTPDAALLGLLHPLPPPLPQHPEATEFTRLLAARLGAGPATAYLREPAAEELRSGLAAVLPAALVPAVFVVLDALPLSVSGKLDRAALPDPGPREPGEGSVPRTPAETALCTAFAEVLGLDRVDADADFFALGGDSVSSLRLVGRLVRDGLDLTVRDVFTHRTPERLAAAARPAAPPDPAPREPEGGEFADLLSPDEFADLAQAWREQD